MDPIDETQTATELPNAKPTGREELGGNPEAPSLGSGPLPLIEVPAEYYALEGEAGRGGIGIVLRARDRRTDRLVALKQLQSLSSAARSRFEREMRITAKLQHPGVVPVHETGKFASGEPFYAMKLVEGRSLKEVIAEKTLDERLALLPNVLAVAETIAYAHSKGVIHRDLKPSNIIVGDFGETVVIDWGLAKAKDLSSEEPESACVGPYRDVPSTQEVTVAGTVLGTPAYMPPEQARGEAVDETGDVYAIGAILYHLLSGRSPYEASASAEILALVLSGPPREISETCAGASADLCAIVRKSMARDPVHRYRHAGQLAEDLRRYQTGQWVTARTYSAADVLARWVRRHRAVITMAMLSLAALGVFGVVSVRRILREQQTATQKGQEALVALGREKAANMESRAQSRRLLLTQAEQFLDRDPTYAIDLLLRRGPLEDADSQVYARQAFADSISYFRREAGRTTPGIAASRDGEAIALDGNQLEWWDLKRRARLFGFPRTSSARTIRFARDGTFLVTGDWDGTVTLWRPSAEPVVLAQLADVVTGLDVSPDGQLVACGTVGYMTTYNLNTREVVSRYDSGNSDFFTDVAFTSDGRSLVAVSGHGTVAVLDVRQRTWRTLARGAGSRFAFSALVDDESSVATWDGHALRLCPLEAARCRAYHPGDRDGIPLFLPGTHKLAFCNSGYVELVDGVTSEKRLFLKGRGITRCLATSRDGALVAARDGTGALVVLRVSDGASVTLSGHDNVDEAAFLGSGKEVISAGTEGSVRIWRAPVFPRAAWAVDAEPAQAIGGSPDREGLAIRLVDGRVAFWTPTGFRYYEPPCRARAVQFLDASSPVYLLCGNGLLQAIDPDGRARSVADLASWGEAIVSSASGRYVAASSSDGRIVLIDRSSAGLPSFLKKASNAIFALAFTPDERSIIGAVSTGDVLRWNLETGTSELLYKSGVNIRTLAWAREKRVILSGSEDGEVYAFDLQTNSGGQLVKIADPVSRVRTDSTGTTVAILTSTGLLDVRHVDGKRLFEERGVRSMSFASKGTLLAITHDSGLIRVVDTDDSRTWSIMAHPHALLFAFFLPDGRRLISIGKDRFVKVWSLEDLQPESLVENVAMFSQWKRAGFIEFDE